MESVRLLPPADHVDFDNAAEAASTRTSVSNDEADSTAQLQLQPDEPDRQSTCFDEPLKCDGIEHGSGQPTNSEHLKRIEVLCAVVARSGSLRQSRGRGTHADDDAEQDRVAISTDV
eukprot:366130-Chlamydomonas_euryale.AAC.75